MIPGNMAQEFLNVLDPQYTRYIYIRDEIEAYLTDKYGENINFQILVRSLLGIIELYS